MSSSDWNALSFPQITSLPYHDVRSVAYASVVEACPENVSPERAPAVEEQTFTKEEVLHQIAQASARAAADAEARVRNQYEAKLGAERQKIAEAVLRFSKEREQYYSKVEAELVQLSLAIAGKVLHREAQVDKMLLAALARLAVENLQHRSNVVVRVRPEDCERWRDYFQLHLKGSAIQVLEDSQLQENDCILETELGTADISIDAQLKEIGRGLFDLLAQRPDVS